MKIIHITLGKANPERMNGVNKVVNSLITSQVNIGLDAELWGITHSLTHNYPKRNYTTRIFQDYSNKFNLDPELINELKKIAFEDVIVHFHGVFLPQVYSASRWCKKLKIPYVYTPHGGYNLRAMEKSKTTKLLYLNLLEKKVVRGAKHVHLIGASEAEGLKKYFNSDQYILVPNGQDIQFRIEKKVSTSDTLNLIFLGRIDIKTKGLDILLEAIAALKGKQKIKLSVVGDGGEMNRLKSLVKELELEQQIEFVGALFGEEKFRALSEADALCLVSRNEGLPGVVLEAASVKTPSIISAYTNMKNYIQDFNAGWCMQKYSVAALTEVLDKVAQLKKEKQLKSFGENAQNMVESAFDWNHIAETLNQHYRA